MGKKWPVLPVLAMLEDKVEAGEEPGRCVGLTRSLVLSTVEFSRWLEAESGIPLDQRGVWQKMGRSLRPREMLLLPPFMLERVASRQCPAAGLSQVALV
jgi:hypothetical protein